MIAGSGPLDQLLRRRAAELGVEVEWLGVQPSLDWFFGSIDLFLLTSDFEGLPMTVLEALQRGVPVAAMAVDGIREEFTDEIALLDPKSSDLEIGRRIDALLQESDGAKRTDSARDRSCFPPFFCSNPDPRNRADYLELVRKKSA